MHRHQDTFESGSVTLHANFFLLMRVVINMRVNPTWWTSVKKLVVMLRNNWDFNFLTFNNIEYGSTKAIGL